MSETIIETRTCRACQSPYPITDRDIEFYTKVSPTFNGKKEFIPPPTLCPDCRQQRRLAFRNERKLYRRTCDLTGQSILSLYSPDKSLKVYDQKAWQSDAWSAFDYSRDFDFSRTFMEQYGELYRAIPHANLMNPKINTLENAEYNNYIDNAKNAYLNFGGSYIQDSSYTTGSIHLTNCLDIWWSTTLTRSYECVNSGNGFECFFVRHSDGNTFCSFCEDCIKCSHCLFCVGLRNQQYCIMNQQHTKEEYEEKIKSFSFRSLPMLSAQFEKFHLSCPHPASRTWGSEDCTGDYIYFSKDCLDSYIVTTCRGTRYLCEGGRVNDTYDGSYVYDGEGRIIEGISIDFGSQVGFSSQVTASSSIYYSAEILSCHDLFGCVGLRNASHCILNKKYSEKEYDNLVSRIVAHMRETGEWGEFFDPSVSPFGYHETVAMEYFPLDRDPAIKQGFGWSDYEAPAPQVSKTLPANRLPDDITAVPDDILDWAIVCEITGKPFKITRTELAFYRDFGLPIPRRHPDQRHLDRIALRNPCHLYDRPCAQCGTSIRTTYAPSRPEQVYCDSCHKKFIYG